MKLLYYALILGTVNSFANINGKSDNSQCFHYKDLDASSVILTGRKASCWSSDLVIPNTIDNKKVTRIGHKAFYKKDISSVIISDGITEIGPLAFQYNNLKSVSIPSSVRLINSYAFSDNELQSINLSEGVKHIGNYTFSYNDISRLKLPNTLELLGERSFAYNKISKLDISNSLSEIEEGAFLDNKLTELRVPQGVTSIRASSFLNNALLKNIYFAESVRRVSSRFAGQYQRHTGNINEITIGKNVEFIGNHFSDIALEEFRNFYIQNGSVKGTYKVINGIWILSN